MRRRHEVTAVLRDPTRVTVLPSAVTIRTGNAANAGDVAELSVGQDLVITATRPAPGSERDLVATVEALLAGLRLTGVRVVSQFEIRSYSDGQSAAITRQTFSMDVLFHVHSAKRCDV